MKMLCFLPLVVSDICMRHLANCGWMDGWMAFGSETISFPVRKLTRIAVIR